MTTEEVLFAITHTPTEEFLARFAELSAAGMDVGLSADEINDALDARQDLPRPLLPIERETLLAILGYADFEGRDQLVEQVDHATVIGYCPCGCATVALQVAPDAPRTLRNYGPIPNEAIILDADCEIGVILVFTDGGYLSALEVGGWTRDDERICPLPPLDQLRIEAR